MSKPIKVNQLMVYRIHKAGYDQDTRGRCLICNNAFQSCPHSFGQSLEAIRNTRIGIGLGMFTTQKPQRETK